MFQSNCCYSCCLMSLVVPVPVRYICCKVPVRCYSVPVKLYVIYEEDPVIIYPHLFIWRSIHLRPACSPYPHVISGATRDRNQLLFNNSTNIISSYKEFHRTKNFIVQRISSYQEYVGWFCRFVCRRNAVLILAWSCWRNREETHNLFTIILFLLFLLLIYNILCESVVCYLCD